MLRFFEKKVFGGCKSRIFYLVTTNMWGVVTEWRMLRDILRGMETVFGAWRSFRKSGGLDVIFSGLMVPLLPPAPSILSVAEKLNKDNREIKLRRVADMYHHVS